MFRPPDYIRRINPYQPGKPVEELERELGISGSIKLASNENPLGPSPLALKALRREISSVHRYPDGNCHYLRAALAENLKVNRDELVFGNGSNEIIELAVRTFLQSGDEAIMAHPSFVVYSTIVQAAGGRSIAVPLSDWHHDLSAMAARITKKTKIIFIANPNNPTGTIVTKNEMERFFRKIPKRTLVIIDEAYYEYVTAEDYPDSTHYLKLGRPVLILRTFSKAYGLAGLRVGFGITSSVIAGEMDKVRQPFNVNTLAQKAATAALSDSEHIVRSRRVNEQGKSYLYARLKALGLPFVPTEANFIYLPLERDAAYDLYDKLLNKGVIVRPMGPRAIRITIGLPGENRRLIQSLTTILSRGA